MIIQEFVIKALVKEAMKALIKKWAFFAAGPLNWLALRYIEKTIIFIINNTSLFIHFKIIDYKVDKQTGKVSVVLKQYNEGITNEERKKLDEQLADTANDLIELEMR